MCTHSFQPILVIVALFLSFGHSIAEDCVRKAATEILLLTSCKSCNQHGIHARQQSTLHAKNLKNNHIIVFTAMGAYKCVRNKVFTNGGIIF